MPCDLARDAVRAALALPSRVGTEARTTMYPTRAVRPARGVPMTIRAGIRGAGVGVGCAGGFAREAPNGSRRFELTDVDGVTSRPEIARVANGSPGGTAISDFSSFDVLSVSAAGVGAAAVGVDVDAAVGDALSPPSCFSVRGTWIASTTARTTKPAATSFFWRRAFE